MAYSYVQYVGNNSTVTFSVPFPYISKAHVEVRINNVLKTVGTDYTWSSTSAITFVTAPGTGLTVDIRRKSSPSARLVDFQDGSTLTQDILDADSNQNFFLAQEATDAVAANIALDTDGLFDAKSKRIKNVADPVNAQDAVTKNYADNGMTSQLNIATAQATAAASSAANSLSSSNASAASAVSASGSAATATTKATEASTSATNAASSATSANNSKVAAATSETNAAASASAAASSASSASSSAASATGSANSASNSAATATTKASDAAGSATQAANSASGAATSATNAASSASSASGSATSAASSASSASTSATNAASSATSASGSASTATTKAAEAAASATTATTQASTATTKASEAAASAVSAANSAAAAATALDNFDDRYLGQKTADPTLDNDGNALVTGALYFNTTTGKMRVFTGSGWIDASSASVATLAVFNYVATAGQTTFSGNDAAGVNLVYTVGAVIVTLNGIDQKNGVDYTATTGSSIVLTSAAAAGDELRVYAFGNFQVADTYSQAAADAKFVQKDASGNVGIGTSSPAKKLDVTGTGRVTGEMTFGNDVVLTNDAYVYSSNGGGVRSGFFLDGTNAATRFYTAGTERMRITSAGNVGIAATAPFYPLEVNKTSNAGSISSGGNFLAAYSDGYVGLGGDSSNGNANIMAQGGSKNIVFGGWNSSQYVERARITYDGKLFVGTTGGNGKFSVTDNGAGAAGLWISYLQSYNYGQVMALAASSGYMHYFTTQGNTVGYIYSDSSSTSYNTSSDYRLKENVQPMQNALATVAQLNPVTYNWKLDGKSGQGFIAHELQAIVPEAVTGEKDAVDDEGNPLYQGVDTSFLVATLTKAIQEQQEQITVLAAKVAALEAK